MAGNIVPNNWSVFEDGLTKGKNDFQTRELKDHLSLQPFEQTGIIYSSIEYHVYFNKLVFQILNCLNPLKAFKLISN